MAGEVQTIEGRVERLLFSNPETGFTVARVSLHSGGSITVAGRLGDVVEDDEIRALGMREEHQRYGTRFRATSGQRVTPSTLQGIVRYLAGPRVHGIGPELAKRLVTAFGSATLEVLDDHPERLTEVPGIGAKRAEKIASTWTRERQRREALVFLQGHGLGPAISLRVVETLGDGALEILQRDPYRMVESVRGVGFRTADNLARSVGIEPGSPSRLRAGIAHLLDAGLVAGHLARPGEELLAAAVELLGVPVESIRPVLGQMARDGRLVIARPRGEQDGPTTSHKVYLPFAFEGEIEAANLLRDLLVAPDPAAALLALHPVDDLLGHLSGEQREAVHRILGAKLSVLTGGPGVGKTTVVKSLVAAWHRARLEVVLACPTGRAAKRLEEVSGLAASTIHRLLKFDARRRRFAHGPDFPIRAQVLVVDEASMLDLPLTVHLLRSLRPDTRVLFVGDADQLPSVGPGRVLGDLIDSDVMTVSRLTRIFRQSARSSIVRLAHAVLHGEVDVGSIDGAEVVFEPCENPEDGAQRVVELALGGAARHFGGRGSDDVQILTPMHRGPTGTRELNRAIQMHRAKDAPVLEAGELVFAAGDRVMQIKNDYDRELFNGDVGLVLEIDPVAHRVVVAFDGREHAYERAQLADLRPAWAISVHKSQGGEYPVVVLPLFPHHFLMLQRQVLYTAITRARRGLFIVGSRRALARAVANNDMATRTSHFGDWLAGREAEVWGRPEVPPTVSSVGHEFG